MVKVVEKKIIFGNCFEI